eukprot:jgi/Tetstr1/421152/TSEL_012195.t1
MEEQLLGSRTSLEQAIDSFVGSEQPREAFSGISTRYKSPRNSDTGLKGLRYQRSHDTSQDTQPEQGSSIEPSLSLWHAAPTNGTRQHHLPSRSGSRSQVTFVGTNRQPLPTTPAERQSGSAIESAWGNLQDVASTIAGAINPHIHQQQNLTHSHRRSLPDRIGEPGLKETLSVPSRLLDILMDDWMALHKKTKLEDEQRTSAYYEVTGEKDSEEHHTPRKIKDFDPEPPLSREALLIIHPELGESLDLEYVALRLATFESAFKSLYDKAEGAVPWQALQFCRYLFHQVSLLVGRAVEEIDTLQTNSTEAMRATAQQLRLSESDTKREIEELRVLVNELNIKTKAQEAELAERAATIADLKRDLSAHDAMRRATFGRADAKHETDLQAVIDTLHDRLGRVQTSLKDCEGKCGALEAKLAASMREETHLRLDLGRKRDQLRLVQDVLPGNSHDAATRLHRFADILSRAQMDLLKQAVNVGSDPRELYALMTERTVAGVDFHPVCGLVGSLRATFDDIRVRSEKGIPLHAAADTMTCKLDDQPLTKAYVTSLLKKNDAKKLKSRLGATLAQQLSLAYHRGMDPTEMCLLLDGRMSSQGLCMVTYRGLMGALTEHEEFKPDGPLATALANAVECCSVVTMSRLKSEKVKLEQELATATERVVELEQAVRLRDFKFGKVVGFTPAAGVHPKDEPAGIIWSEVSKLDEFLSRDYTDSFQGLGLGPDVPKFMRAEGEIEKEDLPKKVTEELIADIWHSKEADNYLNRRHHQSMADYLESFLQTRFGEDDAAKMGYNLVYSCHKYKYDPDCDLFLQVLDCRVSQDLYSEIENMCHMLTKFMRILDYDINPKHPSGLLSVTEIKAVLQCFFANKSNGCIDAMVAALQRDATERSMTHEEVGYLGLFEDDDDANQGHFATLLKKQHLCTRHKFLHDLQEGLLQISKEEDVQQLGSRHVEQAVRGVEGEKLSRDAMDSMLELALGTAWRSGVTETVMAIMKGLRRGHRHTHVHLTDAQVLSMVNAIRECLQLPKQTDKRTRDTIVKVAAEERPVKESDKLSALLLRRHARSALRMSLIEDMSEMTVQTSSKSEASSGKLRVARSQRSSTSAVLDPKALHGSKSGKLARARTESSAAITAAMLAA